MNCGRFPRRAARAWLFGLLVFVLGSYSAEAQFTPSAVYVTNNPYDSLSYPGTVTQILIPQNIVNNTYIVGREPRGVAVSADGAHVYVANFGDGTVSVIRDRKSVV